MKNTETKWTKLISVRIDKETLDELEKRDYREFDYYRTLSGKINYILNKYIKEKQEYSTENKKYNT